MSRPPSQPGRLRAWLALPLRLLLALAILFEEWGWEPLQRLMERLARLPLLRALEALIARLPPYAALGVLLIPWLALLPVKIGALWLLAHGQRGLGLTVIVVAKVVGTAVLARLFKLTQPALMRLTWFASLYGRWALWKGALLAWIRNSAVWRSLHHWRLQARESARRWRRRWFGQ